MTDELMTEIAQDYMRRMGLTNTPFIVVRHYDKEHPHCHIVFSRVDYDGKILTQTTNFKKNERVCKGLNRKYQLMQGKSKLNTDVSKLRGKEKVRYQLVQDIAKLFIHPSVKDWDSYLNKHVLKNKRALHRRFSNLFRKSPICRCIQIHQNQSHNRSRLPYLHCLMVLWERG